MSGDRVRSEGIEHQDIELAIGSLFDGKTAVTDNDITILAAAAEEGEEMQRDVLNLGVNIEESDVPIRPHPSSHRAGAKPHDADMLIRPVVNHLHNIAHGSGFVIVGDRLAVQRGILAFQTVKGVPMQQLPHVGLRLEHDPLETKEIARRVQQLIIGVEEGRKRKTIAEDQDNHCKREADAPFSKQVSH